jgi:hypothetical protein
MIAFLRLIWAYLSGIRRYLTKENIEKALEYARRVEDTLLNGGEKRERVIKWLAVYLQEKYGKKIPAWIIDVILHIALGKLKKAGQEDA